MKFVNYFGDEEYFLTSEGDLLRLYWDEDGCNHMKFYSHSEPIKCNLGLTGERKII